MEVKDPAAPTSPPLVSGRPPKIKKPFFVQAWKLSHAQNSMFDEAQAELGDIFEVNLGRNK
ncbi:MAG: hypothetical protein ACSLFD_00810, partial [Solirubrobacterales bacterium]